VASIAAIEDAEFAALAAKGALDAANDEVATLQTALNAGGLTTSLPSPPPGYSTHLTDVQALLNQLGDPAARRAQIQMQLDQKIIERDARAADYANALAAINTAKIAYEGPSPTNGTKGVLLTNSRRQYCSGSNCNLFYNNQLAMLSRINDYKDKYEKFAVKNKAVVIAQEADNAAARSVIDTLRTLNDINTTSEGTPDTPQAPISLWAGAEAILKAADAKGGSK
jgi:hypothetical protein